MRPLVLILLFPIVALADPTTKPAQRRPGYRIVDGYWAKPQAKINLKDLIKVVDENGKHLLRFSPSPDIEPMLRNGRVSVVEINGSDFAWKLSSPNRVWNEEHTEGIQTLELVAAPDEMKVTDRLAVTRISIRPDMAIVQTVVRQDEVNQNINIVITSSFIELAITPDDKTITDALYRAPTARQLLREHPIETRNYLIPILQYLASDKEVMHPAAGDVYRVFAELKADPEATEILGKLIPELSDADPKYRDRATMELQHLGRRGVQAAMKLDLEKIPPESAERITDYIKGQIRDARPTDQLRIDSNFLLDCLADTDEQVQKAAWDAVEQIAKTTH